MTPQRMTHYDKWSGETIARVRQSNPSQGLWCMTGQDINVWVDASSLATGMLLEHGDVVFKNACWLRPANDAQHINLAKLDAALKGINLTLQLKCKVMHLKTDLVSSTTHRKDQSTHEGHQQNVAPLTIGNDKVAGRRVCTAHGRCPDPVVPGYRKGGLRG